MLAVARFPILRAGGMSGAAPDVLFNVKDYGAVGDGVTDDRTAILAAIAAASGHPVYFSAGTYYCAATLSVPTGTTLIGYPYTGPDACTAWIKGRISFGSDSAFSDLKVGDSGLTTAPASIADSTSFTRCRFRGGGSTSGGNNAVLTLGYSNDISNLTFTDCAIERNVGADATYANYYNNVTIIPDNGGYVDTVTFDGCTFGASNGVATGCPRMNVECVCIGSEATGIYENLTFRDCTFEISNYHNLDLADGDPCTSDGVLVEGCLFKGAGAGDFDSTVGHNIAIEAPWNVVIRDNTFYRCKHWCIAFGGEYIHGALSPATVIGPDNDFQFDYDNGLTDTWAGGSHFGMSGNYIDLTGNTITAEDGPRSYVVWMYNTDNLEITGNTIAMGTKSLYIAYGENTNLTTTPNTYE